MPFVFKNSPATFKRSMKIVMIGLQLESCLVYLGELIVFFGGGETFHDTLFKLSGIFDRFRDANLKRKPKLSILFREEVTFL